MAAPRQGLNPTTHSVGFTAKMVIIRAISADGLTAVCVDRQNTETRVPMLVQRGKGPLPAAGETWLITQDLGIWTFSAFVGQSPSSFAAGSSGQLITVSSSPPPNPSPGQLWMSGAAADELFQWNGSGWISLQFGTSALADSAVTAAKIAPATITTAQIAPNAGITASQVAFAAEDIGALRVFRGPAPPGGAMIGDFWFNTQRGNMLSVWDGNAWAPILLGGAAIQPGSLTADQLSAAAGIGPSQVSFSFRDIGGMTVSMQVAAPPNPLTGDLWYDQTNGYALRQWNGSSWQPYQFGTGAIQARSITAELVAAGTITAQHLAAGIIYAGIINGTTVNAATFTGSVFQGLNFQLTAKGLFFYSGIPAAGNLIAAFAPFPGTDDLGNPFPGVLTAGPSGSGQVVLQPNANQQFNITTAVAGVLMGVAQFFTGDGSQVVPGLLGSVLLGAGAAAKESLIATSPFASTRGAAMILESENDGGTDSPLVTFGTVTSPDSSTVIFTPIMTLTPYALVVYSGAGSQTVVTKISGSGTIPIPAGITVAKAEAWAAGGGSSGTPSSTIAGGVGAGGGEYSSEPNLAVTGPGTVSYSVGAAGTAGPANGNGGNGGNSTLTGTSVTVTANGGAGGVHGSNYPALGTPGAGGAGSTNTIHFPGGAGGFGETASNLAPFGGGGGSSAGPSSAGNNASGGTPGSAPPAGGAGGAGGTGSKPSGAPGVAPGGGAGSASGANQPGTAGAHGQVRLTYVNSTPAVGFSLNFGPAFTDQYGNTIPGGTSIAYTNSSGIAGQLPLSQTDSTLLTVPGASITPITRNWPIPAPDAQVGTVYRIRAFGLGTQGSTQQNLFIDGNNGNPTLQMLGTEIPASAIFSWEAECEMRVTATGVSGLVDNKIKFTWQANAVSTPSNSGPGVQVAHGITFNTTVGQTSQIRMNWASTTGGPTITCYGSTFERLGP